MIRAWINQPSNKSTLHFLHGTNVLAESGSGWITIYMLSGPVISMRAHSTWLSKGWH